MTDTGVIAAESTEDGSRSREILRFLAATLGTRLNIIFAVVVVLYGGTIYGLSRFYDTGITVTSNLYSLPLHLALGFFFIGTIFYRLFYIMLVMRPRRLFRALGEDFKNLFFNPRRMLTALPLVMLMPVFFSLFTSGKSLIPFIHPFDMDPALAQIDKAMHFGRQPWEWLQPLIGFAWASSIISLTYKTWFIMKFFMCLMLGFSLKRPRLREQFFLTFIASWILNGTILAIFLSSAGPCYFDKIYPGLTNPYQGLMSYLREADQSHTIYDFQAMELLWSNYSQRAVGMFSGISAMPSMHVSVAFLFALWGWRVGRRTGIFFSIYLILIMTGSVHIGWHYAIDGYAAILTTAMLWWAIGRWTGKDISRDKSTEESVKV